MTKGEDNNGGIADGVAEDRRAFIINASKAAIVAPAVTLLLNAATKPAIAQSIYQPSTEVMVHPIRG